MDAPESSAVLEEVEALFKKLQHLPDSIRQKALSCIQEKLPDAIPTKEVDEVESQEAMQSSKKDTSTIKSLPEAKVTRSSIALRQRQKSSPVVVKLEPVEQNEQNAPEDSTGRDNKAQPEAPTVNTRSSLRQANIVKPIFKITPKTSVKISSVAPKAKKAANQIDKTAVIHTSDDSANQKSPAVKKKEVKQGLCSDDGGDEKGASLEELGQKSEEKNSDAGNKGADLEDKNTKSDGYCSEMEAASATPQDESSTSAEKSSSVEDEGSKPEDTSTKSDSTSSTEIKGRSKKPFMGPKSAKLAKKMLKSPKVLLYENDEDDETYVIETLTTPKGSAVTTKDLPRTVVYDDGGSVFVLEDIRTLKGRKTKRINLASLSGFRKPRVKVAATTKPTSDSKHGKTTLSPSKHRAASQRIKSEVSSEVAESAEILASLSSGLPHSEGLSQVECLKDKTNNQQSVITYEFEALVGDEDTNTSKEAGEHLPQTKEEFVDLNEDSQPGSVDSDVERDPLEDIEQDAAGEYTCGFCDFKSTTKQSLAAHVRKHKENIPKPEHVCPECNKKFSQSCSLQLHLKRHRGERDFHCPDCDYKAFTKVDLTRHQTIHTGERNKICEYCGKTFAKDSTLRDHVKSVHERKVKHTCEMCGFVTHRANNLRVHIRMRHHGEYNNHVCPVCKASVKQKNAFLEHMRSHTGERPFKCESCSAAFACLARLNVHRNAVHGERQFKCEDCDKCFQTKHHLLRHRAIHTKERPYACPYCSYACNTQGNIAKHVRSIHNLPNFSYRKHKDLVENGGQPRQVDPEWIKKGEEVTEEYLAELSSKMGRSITLEELWAKQAENEKRKKEQERARQEAKERRAIKNEAAGVAYLEKVKKRRLERQQGGDSGKRLKKKSKEDIDALADLECIEDGEEVPLYKLVSQGGSIRLCLETDEVQVYTGDATRDVSFLQMKDNDLNDCEEIQTIQGYMNDDGQFIRVEDGVMVDEDSSTVVVIIDSEMQDEINPDVSEVMEVTCEEDFSSTEAEMLNLNVVSASKEAKPSVLRVIKQEI